MMEKTSLSMRRDRVSHIKYDYLHFGPAALEVRQPLIVYLHGAGHKGTSLEKLSTASLPALLGEELDLPAHVVCPLSRPGPGWLAHHVAIFVEEVIRIHNCDPHRIYLTGESMGGRGVFEVCYWHARLFAAAVPICAFGIPNLATLFKNTPLWMFHGDRDDVLPVERSREMFAALRQQDCPATYAEIAGQGHDIAKSVYRRPELWDWLFQQRLATTFLEPQGG